MLFCIHTVTWREQPGIRQARTLQSKVVHGYNKSKDKLPKIDKIAHCRTLQDKLLYPMNSDKQNWSKLRLSLY